MAKASHKEVAGGGEYPIQAIPGGLRGQIKESQRGRSKSFRRERPTAGEAVIGGKGSNGSQVEASLVHGQQRQGEQGRVEGQQQRRSLWCLWRSSMDGRS